MACVDLYIKSGLTFFRYRGVVIYRKTKDGFLKKFATSLKKYFITLEQYLDLIDPYVDALTDDALIFLKEHEFGLSVDRSLANLFDAADEIIFKGDITDLKQYLSIRKVEGTIKWEEFLSKYRTYIINRTEWLGKKVNLSDGTSVDILPIMGNRFEGLGPDFSRTPGVLYKGDERFGKIRIKLTGNRILDEEIAEATAIKMGLKLEDISKYTWHHLDDFDPESGSCTMQLVLTEVHKKTAPHIGGAKMWSWFYGIEY